jgi:hypothetical protein
MGTPARWVSAGTRHRPPVKERAQAPGRELVAWPAAQRAARSPRGYSSGRRNGRERASNDVQVPARASCGSGTGQPGPRRAARAPLADLEASKGSQDAHCLGKAGLAVRARRGG